MPGFSHCGRFILALVVFLYTVAVSRAGAWAQTSLRKIRIGVSETHVGYLPLQAAFHKGYYKDEGIDLQIVLMPTNIINPAAFTGQIDINGAVTGTVGAAVQGSPMKLLIVTVGKTPALSGQPQGNQRSA
jgi:ABC-type nitrate/sulfonate/bicarbonate transport system substrate-binding protein